MKLPASLVRTPVRVRRTLLKRGASERALIVHCPERRGSCSLDLCRECERCQGLTMDGDGISEVLCNVAVETPRRRKVMPTAAELTPIGTLMTPEVVCVAATLGCVEAMTLFLERGLSGAPVVDGDGRPLGMLARSDLLRAATERPQPGAVADVMMPLTFTLEENDPISRGAAVMAVEGVHHLPIIADHGRVVGLISTLDITRWLARQAGYDV